MSVSVSGFGHIESGGYMTKAAQRLGVPRKTLYVFRGLRARHLL
ncbi:MAG: hypothetical protein HDT28_08855 [Clostridiales bacterium]|nr:hypothetical protein [Clostridiales bacterium]